MLENKHIILASQSPRRQEILRGAGIDFVVRVVDFEEKYAAHILPEQVALYLAEKKAKHFPTLKSGEILITADTVVIINNTILGKPADAEEAAQMLSSLSGKTHQVVTGVVIKAKDKMVSFSETTLVNFKILTDQEIEYYVEKFKPYDKAGAYGVQEWIGMIGINRIEGSYFNVMGLPIHSVYAALMQFR
jgi:septum formation protein